MQIIPHLFWNKPPPPIWKPFPFCLYLLHIDNTNVSLIHAISFPVF